MLQATNNKIPTSDYIKVIEELPGHHNIICVGKSSTNLSFLNYNRLNFLNYIDNLDNLLIISNKPSINIIFSNTYETKLVCKLNKNCLTLENLTYEPAELLKLVTEFLPGVLANLVVDYTCQYTITKKQYLTAVDDHFGKPLTQQDKLTDLKWMLEEYEYDNYLRDTIDNYMNLTCRADAGGVITCESFSHDTIYYGWEC